MTKKILLFLLALLLCGSAAAAGTRPVYNPITGELDMTLNPGVLGPVTTTFANIQAGAFTGRITATGGIMDAVTIGASTPAPATVTAMASTWSSLGAATAESVSVTYGVTGTALYQTDELGAIQASIIDGKAVIDAVSATFLNADGGTIDNATIENSSITGADSIQADKGVLTITNEAGYSLFISFPVTATADVYIRVDENGKVQKENR